MTKILTTVLLVLSTSILSISTAFAEDTVFLPIVDSGSSNVRVTNDATDVVWCQDTIETEDGDIYQVGHPPTIDTYKGNPNTGERFLSTKCWSNWNDVAMFMTDGDVSLPNNATAQDWARAVHQYSLEETEGLSGLRERRSGRCESQE